MIKRITYVLTIALIIASCSKDKEMSEEVTFTSTELNSIFNTDDVAGVADDLLSELFVSGPMTGKTSEQVKCYLAEYSNTGYTVTFDNCTLNGTENINGTVSVSYNLEMEASSFTATYVDFYVGDITINGTRTIAVTNNSADNSFSFAVTSDMEIVMANGDEISEKGTKIFAFSIGEDLQTSTFGLSGNWTLKVDGNTYKVIITSPLSGSAECSFFTEGSMTIDKNGLLVLVDLGDGSCDNSATITYPDGTREEINVKG
jgi:hypothetical protein